LTVERRAGNIPRACFCGNLQSEIGNFVCL
jgi:hypothetical protein